VDKMTVEEITTLSDTEKVALKKLIKLVSETFTVNKTILFGSKARGDYTKDSDTDILFLVQEDSSLENREKIYGCNFEINFEHLTNFSTILRNTKEWEESVAGFIGFPTEVTNDGIEVSLGRAV
jgi:hypothetical protein